MYILENSYFLRIFSEAFKIYKTSSREEKHLLKSATSFVLKIRFERNAIGKTGILINYHLMCAILAMAASINFLIDPKVVPGRAGLLVTLFLVMTGFFSDAQVTLILENCITLTKLCNHCSIKI